MVAGDCPGDRRLAARHGARDRQRRVAREGLITAIVAGFLISALGGSRVQIGGPTGAFVVIVAGVIAAHGFAGLLLATP